jgi:hypothetical protein
MHFSTLDRQILRNKLIRPTFDKFHNFCMRGMRNISAIDLRNTNERN